MTETPGDRVEAFLNTIGEAGGPIIASSGGYGEEATLLMADDLRELLRANDSLARQVIWAGDTIIAAAEEIQRATLRAAADDAESTGHPIKRGYASWLRERAETIGRKVS